MWGTLTDIKIYMDHEENMKAFIIKDGDDLDMAISAVMHKVFRHFNP